MNILCLDFETTSANPDACSITEVGGCLYSTDFRKIVGLFNFLVSLEDQNENLSEEASQVTGITNEELERYGNPINDVIKNVADYVTGYTRKTGTFYLSCRADYIAAHNGEAFDRKIFQRYWADCSAVMNVPWIDTQFDLPTNYNNRDLIRLAASHRYYIQNAHRAIDDAMACAHLISYYPIELIIKNAMEPKYELQAMIGSPRTNPDFYEEKDIAYKAGFFYDKNRNHGRFKICRESEVEAVFDSVPFDVESTPLITENEKILKKNSFENQSE